MFFISDYSINVLILVFLISTVIICVSVYSSQFEATYPKFPSHQHNSSTVPLSTPTL
jgi:hypothetical protein